MIKGKDVKVEVLIATLPALTDVYRFGGWRAPSPPINGYAQTALDFSIKGMPDGSANGAIVISVKFDARFV